MQALTPDTIKAARKRAHLTQRQAAHLIGASVRAWEEWEGGRRNMPFAKFALFAHITQLEQQS